MFNKSKEKDKILVLDSNNRLNNPQNNSPFNYNINSGDTFKPQIRDQFDDVPKTPGSPQTIHIRESTTDKHFAASLNQIYSVKSINNNISQPNTGNTTNHNNTKYNNSMDNTYTKLEKIQHQMRSQNRDEVDETPVLNSLMLQPVNTNTASINNSRPNSMNYSSSRPISKITNDHMYEIQPIKISVKNDRNVQSQDVKQSHRVRSRRSVGADVAGADVENLDSNREKDKDKGNGIGVGKASNNAKWQVADYQSAYNSLENFNKIISETNDEIGINQDTEMNINDFDRQNSNENMLKNTNSQAIVS